MSEERVFRRDDTSHPVLIRLILVSGSRHRDGRGQSLSLYGQWAFTSEKNLRRFVRRKGGRIEAKP